MFWHVVLLPMKGKLKDKLSERDMQQLVFISYANHWKVGGSYPVGVKRQEVETRKGLISGQVLS